MLLAMTQSAMRKKGLHCFFAMRHSAELKTHDTALDIFRTIPRI